MTHLITVYTQRSFLILQCQLPQLFSVSCLISFRYSSFNIFPSFAIYISCTVVLCKHLFIVDASDGFIPRKGTGLRWLISSYQTIHAVKLFYSLHDLLSPPQCNMQCNLCYMSPVLNGSCLTAHADRPISYITYFQMTNMVHFRLLFLLSSIYWAPNQHIRTIWRIKCHDRNNLYKWKNFQKHKKISTTPRL